MKFLFKTLTVVSLLGFSSISISGVENLPTRHPQTTEGECDIIRKAINGKNICLKYREGKIPIGYPID